MFKGGRGGVVPKHPCFSIQRVLSSLAHLNNEPDITERYPLDYFIFGGVQICVLFTIYFYIYVLITYFCRFKFYFDYLFALSMVSCSFFPTYFGAIFFLCGYNGPPSGKNAVGLSFQ